MASTAPRFDPARSSAIRGLDATVLACGELGPTRVRFRFDRSLDDPSITLLAWRDERLRRVEAPPVGGVIQLSLGN